MDDYHDSGYPGSHNQNDAELPDLRPINVEIGWIVAIVFLIAILGVALGVGHKPGHMATNTASNETNPSFVAPITPTPNSPAQRSFQ